MAAIVTISQFSREDIRRRLKIPPDRIFVTPIEVDLHGSFGGSPFPVGLGIKGQYLLSVAASYPYKRLDVVLDVYEKVLAVHPNMEMVFAGLNAGPASIVKALRKRATTMGRSHSIHFLSRVERSDLAALYEHAAVYVSASLFEGFGIPVVEAMAAGCPIAATPAGAVLETTAGHAWIASDTSVDALAGQTLLALAGRETNSARIETARVRARSQFTWEASAGELEGALARVAASAQSVQPTP